MWLGGLCSCGDMSTSTSTSTHTHRERAYQNVYMLLYSFLLPYRNFPRTIYTTHWTAYWTWRQKECKWTNDHLLQYCDGAGSGNSGSYELKRLNCWGQPGLVSPSPVFHRQLTRTKFTATANTRCSANTILE